MNAAEFAAKVRRRETVVGYWIQLDSPASTERVARLGYDYVSLDAQHGLFGYSGMLAALTAIDAAGRAVGLVRVAANDATAIGRALDAGAAGVIAPLVNTAEDAAAAVAAGRYPPTGIRSYGPARSSMRIGPAPAEADSAVVVLAMIETAAGLAERRRHRRHPRPRRPLHRPLRPDHRRRRRRPGGPGGGRRVRGGAGAGAAGLRGERAGRRSAHELRAGGDGAHRGGLHVRHGGGRPHPSRSRGRRAPRRRRPAARLTPS